MRDSVTGGARRMWRSLPVPFTTTINQWRRRGEPPLGLVDFGDLRRVTPICDDFGYSRGGPVDRHYVELFLKKHRGDIAGRVLEIGDNSYTRTFGGEAVTRSDVLNVAPVSGATFVGDLSNGDFLPDAAFDCVVLTQTLHLIFDFAAALRTIERILAPGGVLLVTVPGPSNIDPREWGSTWFYSFTHHTLLRMNKEFLPNCTAEIESWGNVLTSVAFLHGLGAAELTPAELAVCDPDYALIHTGRFAKRRP